MSKKVVVPLAVITFFVFSGIGALIALQTPKTKNAPESEASTYTQTLTPTPIPVSQKTYTDPAGFSFKYPGSLTVKDVTPDNATYYTLLEVSDGTKLLTLTAKDTKAKTVESWFSTDKSAPTEAKLAGAVTLGNLSAKQYTNEGKLYTVAVDQGVVYVVEGPDEEGTWSEIQDTLFSTFTFSGTASDNQATAPSNIIYEEETIQ